MTEIAPASKPKSDFIVASLTLFACVGQLFFVQWDQPIGNVLFQIVGHTNPLLTALIATIVCKKTGKEMPWWGLAFNVCGLTAMGIALLPFTFGIFHIVTLVKAIKRKNYYTILVVPAGIAFIGIMAFLEKHPIF